jgi:hypothetical protein
VLVSADTGLPKRAPAARGRRLPPRTRLGCAAGALARAFPEFRGSSGNVKTNRETAVIAGNFRRARPPTRSKPSLRGAQPNRQSRGQRTGSDVDARNARRPCAPQALAVSSARLLYATEPPQLNTRHCALEQSRRAGGLGWGRTRRPCNGERLPRYQQHSILALTLTFALLTDRASACRIPGGTCPARLTNAGRSR